MSNKTALTALRGFVFLFFFLSGAMGLVCEVIWGRYLQLFIGATTYAHTAVLVAFMGGLALGNSLGGRLADRPIRKLALYGWLEFGIGAFCLLFPVFFEGLSGLYLALATSNPGAAANFVLKFLLAVLAVLPPAVLMGGSLPALSRYIVRNMKEIGSGIGKLYFINSAGAAVGALAAGFLLVEALGLHLGVMAAGALDLVIGLAFLCLKKFEPLPEGALPSTGALQTSHEAAAAFSSDSGRTFSSFHGNAVLAAVFVTGMLTMTYELVWTRLIGLVMGSSSYSFSIMLATFIGGIALGGGAAALALKKDRNALAWFAACELGLFVSLLAMLPLYERLPYFFNVVASLLSRREEAFILHETVKVGTCVAVMLIPSVLIGMSLPLASRVHVKSMSTMGTDVGTVFSANTAGDLVGVVVGGLVLIPWLGLQRTMELSIVLSGAVGCALWYLAVGGARLRRLWPAVALAAGIFVLVAALPSWNLRVLNSGLFRNRDRYADSYDEYLRKLADMELIYQKDGADLSVAVTRVVDDNRRLYMSVNGKADASTASDMRNQLFLGHLPMMLHEHPRTALVIGLGSGVTAGAVLRHPVERLDVVEISSAVVDASRLFDHASGAPLDDPRTNLVVTDAREFLQLQKSGRYDVIISEPSNPWVAGIASLFTVEYFAQARERLADQGLMVQWVQTYEINDLTMEIILNSFGAVFPHVTIWNPRGGDMLLVGSLLPQAPDFDVVEKRLSDPAVFDSLNQDLVVEKTRSLLGLLALQTMSSDRFRALYPGRPPVNRDFFPLLEFEAARCFFMGDRPAGFFARDERRLPRSGGDLFLTRWLKGRQLADHELEELIDYFAFGTNESDIELVKGLTFAYLLRKNASGAALQRYLWNGSAVLAGRYFLWERRKQEGPLEGADAQAYHSFLDLAQHAQTNAFLR